MRPVHCLIVRGRTTTLVRRWAPDTRLNGRAFLDEALEPGDLLSIGPVDLEVVSLGPSPAAEAEQIHWDRTALVAEAGRLKSERAALAAQFEQLESERTRLAAEAERIEAQRAALAAQSQRVEEAAANLEARREQFEAQCAAWNAQQAETAAQCARRSQTLEQFARELDQARDDLDRRRRAWEAEQPARVRELEQRAKQLDTRQQELDKREKDLNQQQQLLAARAARLDDRQGELDQREKQLSEHQQMIAQHAARLDARQQDLDQLAEQLESRRRGLQSPEAALVERSAAGQSQHDCASEPAPGSGSDAMPSGAPLVASPVLPATDERLAVPQTAEQQAADVPSAAEQAVLFQTPAERAPVELAAVLQRMGAAPLVPDEEPAREPAAGPVELRALEAFETPKEEEELAEEADSASIDIYMAGLLQRARGWTGQSSGPRDEPSTRPTNEAQHAGQLPQREVSWRSRAKPKEHDRPRQRAPESELGLSAMRQLASQAARAAIHSHIRRETIRARWGKLLVALTGLVLGIVLLTMWQRGAAGAVSYYGGLVGLMVALVWGLQYGLLSGRLIVNRFGSLDLNKPGPEAAEPLPPAPGEGPIAAPGPPDAH